MDQLSTRPRVLLADDYPDIVKAVSRLLAPDCEIVGSVTDGTALLETAQRLPPDVLVLDVNLPNIHSLEACREITRSNPDDEGDHVLGYRRSEPQPGVPRGRSICLRLETRRPLTCCQPSSVCVSIKLTPASSARYIAPLVPRISGNVGPQPEQFREQARWCRSAACRGSAPRRHAFRQVWTRLFSGSDADKSPTRCVRPSCAVACRRHPGPRLPFR